ncbi:MAG: SET domain-containing protein [Xanthobacteraceae bacterium]|nr:SET domain-containing protein [Xanthobacteraceae bacterium]
MTSASSRPYRVGRSRTGLGLFATAPIRKGKFIVEYTGRKLPNKIADELNNKYLFEINSRWTVDGSTRRNVARYINHSCRPNAESDVIGHKVIIRAIRNIPEGAEITYDYGKDYFTTFLKPIGCRCAACVEKRRRARAEARAAAARKRARAARKAEKAKAAKAEAKRAKKKTAKTAATRAANGHKANGAARNGANGHAASRSPRRTGALARANAGAAAARERMLSP